VWKEFQREADRTKGTLRAAQCRKEEELKGFLGEGGRKKRQRRNKKDGPGINTGEGKEGLH